MDFGAVVGGRLFGLHSGLLERPRRDRGKSGTQPSKKAISALGMKSSETYRSSLTHRQGLIAVGARLRSEV
ncbi:hypothetical protein Isop_1919 [Isosphaera pallida ATCC 43644]|uniref:Uncharacterized protein n=1 Tax=Isosphaera pallida (strain ATCC 43644 / DSM 9630 / IS1B) TaxID=575540 RepID=E8R2J9_ISOPI|nr:hypothetical protein Isop_1919 [Isosphaera pallida ATCC 43644]